MLMAALADLNALAKQYLRTRPRQKPPASRVKRKKQLRPELGSSSAIITPQTGRWLTRDFEDHTFGTW